MSIVIPPELEPIAELTVGQEFPQGDEDKLAQVGAVWDQVAGGVNRLVGELNPATAATFESLEGAPAKQFAEFVNQLNSTLPVMSVSAQQLATLTRNAALEIEYAKYMIILQLAWMAAEIVYLTSTLFGSAAVPAVLTAGRLAIQMVLRRLFVAVLSSVVMQVGMDAAVQLLQFLKGDRKHWNVRATESAAEIGGLGGALGGVLGEAMRIVSPDIAKSLAGTVATGALTGLGATELNNAIFNSRQSLELGAAAGGLGGAIAHGHELRAGTKLGHITVPEMDIKPFTPEMMRQALSGDPAGELRQARPEPAARPDVSVRLMFHKATPETLTVIEHPAQTGVVSEGLITPGAHPQPAADRTPAGSDVAPVVDLDHEYGPPVGPKHIKDQEKGPDGVLRLNPLWFRLGDFPPALLDRTEGKWQYAVDAAGEIQIGSENIRTVLTDEEWQQLADGIQRTDPGTNANTLQAALDGAGHPTILAQFDESGRLAERPMARISGELYWNQDASRWEINDKSGRYMRPKVRPVLRRADVARWVENVASRMSVKLGREVAPGPIKYGEGPSVPVSHLAGPSQPQDPAHPSAKGETAAEAPPRSAWDVPPNTDLDHEYGPLADPKHMKNHENGPDGLPRLNPLLFRLGDFPPALLERTDGNWQYAVDAAGEIRLGSENVRKILTGEEWKQLADGIQRTDPGTNADTLQAALDGAGHPTLVTQFDESGRPMGRPRARISGELYWNQETSQWEVNDKSGRYMSSKVRPNLDPADVGRWVGNVASRMSSRFGGNVVPALYKQREPQPVPSPRPAQPPQRLDPSPSANLADGTAQAQPPGDLP